MSVPVPPHPLEAPAGGPPRWTDAALPPYRHVPGLTPHPVNDPKGHSFGISPLSNEPFAIDIERDWRRCEPYLYGVDLFNAAYLWEAHESWEEVWHAVGHRSWPGRMVQAMIQVAAALLQHHRGIPRGAERNFAKAGAHLSAIGERLAAESTVGSSYLGVSLDLWPAAAGRFLGRRTEQYPFLHLRTD